MNMAGIYKITNKVNGKVYIGQSGNLKARERQHFSDLRNNRHKNKILQNSWNKYGENNFEFEVIEYASDIELNELERYFGELYNVYDRKFGYNIAECGGNSTSKLHSKSKKEVDEIKIKMSNSKKKNIYSQYHCELLEAIYTCDYYVKEGEFYFDKDMIANILKYGTSGESYCAFIIYMHIQKSNSSIIFTGDMWERVMKTSERSFSRYTKELDKYGIFKLKSDEYKPSMYNIKYKETELVSIINECERDIFNFFKHVYFSVFTKQDIKKIVSRRKYNTMFS